MEFSILQSELYGGLICELKDTEVVKVISVLKVVSVLKALIVLRVLKVLRLAPMQAQCRLAPPPAVNIFQPVKQLLQRVWLETMYL